MSSPKLRNSVLALAATVGLVFATPTIASASNANSESAVPTTVTIEGVSPGESETVQLDDNTTMTIEMSEAEIVSASDIQSDKSLSAAQKQELLSAQQNATIRSAHWSQATTGVVYTQTQNGTAYWNGSRVWVTQTYQGRNGSHACFTNYVVPPWSIKNIDKSDSGSTTQRTLRCGWNVMQAGILETSWSMTAKIDRNGKISGGGASIG